MTWKYRVQEKFPTGSELLITNRYCELGRIWGCWRGPSLDYGQGDKTTNIKHGDGYKRRPIGGNQLYTHTL